MRKIFSFLFSPRSAVIWLLLYAVAMAAATFIENDFGTQTARAVVYNATWFELLMLLLAISFMANIFKYRLYSKNKWPILLFHIAFLIILLGAAVTRYAGFEGILRIREGDQSNTIISDQNYLQVYASNGSDSIEIKDEMYFSPIKNNVFSLHRTIGNTPLEIAYKDFIADAGLEMNDVTAQGKHIIEFVVSTGSGRKTQFLSKGETIFLGDHKHSLSFEKDSGADLFFFSKGDSLFLKSKEVIDIFVMSTQSAGRIEAGRTEELRFNTLHRYHDISFVPVNQSQNAAIQWESKAKKPKDNDELRDDILVLEVKSESFTKEISLIYKHGFLPEFKEVELNNLKVRLAFGSHPIPMGFSLKLRDFQLERYPGSTSPSSYASEVTVIEPQEQIDYRIYMNHVLDHKGFRFYQASYDTDEKGTVLAVNHDWVGTWLTYLGYTLMGIGMFITLFWQGSRFQKVRLKLEKVRRNSLVLICLFMLGTGVSAQPDVLIAGKIVPKAQADLFGRLMVQDLDGRIKPINTLSSEFLRKVSRKNYYTIKGTRLSSDQVFLAIHMYPEIWSSMPLIKIDFKKGGAAFEKLPNQNESLLSFADFLGENGDYLLEKQVQAANLKKPAERSESDKELIQVDERFNIVYNVLAGNYLKLFPKRDDPSKTWFDSNHDFRDFNEEDGIFCAGILTVYFEEIEAAFLSGDWKTAEEKRAYIAKYQEVLAFELIPVPKKIEAELWYNNLNLNFWLFQSYFLLGVIMLILALGKVFSQRKYIPILQNIFVVLVLISFILQAGNLILRWYIAGHPPWSNGYEMIVFVSWCLLLFGLIFYKKSDFVLPLATIFTGTLLFVSYLDWLNPEITTLMPVLKSYWLKIHVAIIISSYAPLALSALLGLMSLILMILQKRGNNLQLNRSIMEMTYINELSMTIGLFLLSIGTFLGGVWANESWGRYWAWDPKETWALISIIVYAAVLHLRLIPGFKERFILNAASIYAFYSIMMTSFGVNYYLTGLHSYATGDPVPIPTFVYVTVATILVVTIWAFQVEKSKKKLNY